MAKLTLTAQQQAVVENRGGSLLVSAAAGSGKTKVLVDRLFRYVTEERCNIDDFLIITYTKAAAAELRGKIASELSRRLAETPGDGQLRRQMLRVYQADIKTVDAFCTALLRENTHLLAREEDSLAITRHVPLEPFGLPLPVAVEETTYYGRRAGEVVYSEEQALAMARLSALRALEAEWPGAAVTALQESIETRSGRLYYQVTYTLLGDIAGG